jgi:hypothetical protein
MIKNYTVANLSDGKLLQQIGGRGWVFVVQAKS